MFFLYLNDIQDASYQEMVVVVYFVVVEKVQITRGRCWCQ